MNTNKNDLWHVFADIVLEISVTYRYVPPLLPREVQRAYAAYMKWAEVVNPSRATSNVRHLEELAGPLNGRALTSPEYAMRVIQALGGI